MSDEEARELINEINELTREEALEGSLALSHYLQEDRDVSEQQHKFIDQVSQDPYAHLDEIEDLTRVLLLTAAAESDLQPIVREILDSVGRKAFIFGGAEIVALAGLGVATLTILLAKGKSSETEHLEISDGKLVYERKTVYVTGTRFAKMLANLLPHS